MKLPISLHRVFLIVAKDFREFSRDKLWMLLSPVSLLMFAGLLLLLPDNPIGMIPIGVYPALYAEFAGKEADITGFNSVDALSRAVLESNELLIGVAFKRDSVELFFSSLAGPLQRRAAGSAVREVFIARQALEGGRNPLSTLPVILPEFSELLAGSEGFSLKDKLKPLLFVVVLLVEALALAGLIAVEIETGTAQALLVTPTTTKDLILAKVITGILLAMVQAILFLLLTGSLSSGWFALLVLTILGAWMASSVGLIAGTAGRDFTGTLFMGLLLLFPLFIPAFALLFSRAPFGILRIIPSYGLVMSAKEILVNGKGLPDVIPFLTELFVWNCVLAFSGLFVLKRKVESL